MIKGIPISIFYPFLFVSVFGRVFCTRRVEATTSYCNLVCVIQCCFVMMQIERGHRGDGVRTGVRSRSRGSGTKSNERTSFLSCVNLCPYFVGGGGGLSSMEEREYLTIPGGECV